LLALPKVSSYIFFTILIHRNKKAEQKLSNNLDDRFCTKKHQWAFNTTTWVLIKRWNVHTLLWLGKEHKHTHRLGLNEILWQLGCGPKATTLEYYVEGVISSSGWTTKQNNSPISLWITVSPAVHKESCVIGKREPLIVYKCHSCDTLQQWYLLHPMYFTSSWCWTFSLEGSERWLLG